MNKIFYLIIFTFLLINTSFCQDTKWVSTIKSQGYDDCHDIYTDPHGNTYATGQIEYTASFDGYTQSSYGSHDIFIAKYDSSGTLIWANHAGGSDGDIGLSIAADYAGNSYVVGEFESTSHFDGISKTAQGSNNIFIAKYDTAGNAVWVKNIGTNSGSTKGYAVACDSLGNVYASGTTRAKAYYNGSSLFTSRGSEDILIIKFDTDGNYKWYKQIGGSDSDEGFGLAVSGDYLYVTGSFEGTAKFSSSFSLDADGGKDFFLAQYDTSGNFNWAEAGGGNGDDIGWDVTVNTNGDVVCTGEYRGTGSFGSNTISSNGSSDIFIAAYNSIGDNIWCRGAGGNDIDFGHHLTHDSNGNLLISGNYVGPATMDTTLLIGIANEDVFLACYDSVGNFLYVKSFGGPEHDRGEGVGSDKYGNVYFSGEYWTSINFDSISVTGNLLYDAFIVRFGNYPICSATTTITNNISCFNNCDGDAFVTPVGMPPFIYEWQLLPQLHTNYATGLCAGNYPVDITDGYGCVISTSINISQPSPLSINNIVVSNTTCIGCTDGSIDVTVSGGVPPFSFMWDDGSISEDRNNLIAGIYDLCITDSNNCSFCTSFNVQNGTIGISTINSTVVMSVYPNPASTQTEIHLDKSLPIESFRIELTNSIGETIKLIPVNENTIHLSINNFSNGIYFLKLCDKETGAIKNIAPILVLQQ